MFLSNFHFLGFAKKGHFQAVKFFLTDGPTNLRIEAPCRSLKRTQITSRQIDYRTIYSN